MVTFLLKYTNIDINKQNNAGLTPLMWAVGNNNALVVKLLLDRGADIHIKNKAGKTAYQMISKKNNDEILELFEKKKVN